MEKMRAARMVEVGKMECEEIEIPHLADGQVMVRSEMASICGSDLHVVMMGAGVGHPCPCPHGYPIRVNHCDYLFAMGCIRDDL